MWVLMVITLQLTNPVHVLNADMVEKFTTQKKCLKKAKYIMDKAHEDNKPVPPQINLGCVPFTLDNPYV